MATLTLDLSREGERLKISVHEGRTFDFYDYATFAPGEIQELSRKIIEGVRLLTTRVGSSVGAQLKYLGQYLFDCLLPLSVKERLQITRTTDLVFNLDESLIHIPWELLHDGDEFFCRRFNMGRLVKTRMRLGHFNTREINVPVKMQILCDPQGNLSSAYAEGATLLDSLDRYSDRVIISWRGKQITQEYVRRTLRDFDIVHYAGHATYNSADPSQSGWLLKGTSVTAELITRLRGNRPFPSLVFSNSCQSSQMQGLDRSRETEEEIFGLANAFLLAGVRHYIGTFAEILDEQAAGFALEFYKELIMGTGVGECVRIARNRIVEKYGEGNAIWASYLLYGDPSFRYFPSRTEHDDLAHAHEAIGGPKQDRESRRILRREHGGISTGKPSQAAPSITNQEAHFIVGPPITHPRHFFGRTRILKRLFNLWKFSPMQNAAILDPRRSGKTSLLFYVSRITRAKPEELRPNQQRDWLPQPERYSWIYVDFQDPRMGRKSHLLRHILENMTLSFENAPQLREHYHSVIQNHKPCELGLFIELMAAGLRTPIVLLLDEIGVAMQRYPELDNSFWEALRSVANNQVRGNLAFVLSASERPEEMAHRSGMSSPFFNIFGFTGTLGPLEDNEARELISASPVPVASHDIEWILEKSGRWPILVQILCRECLSALEDREIGEAWREEGLRQIEPFRHLFSESAGE